MMKQFAFVDKIRRLLSDNRYIDRSTFYAQLKYSIVKFVLVW